MRTVESFFLNYLWGLLPDVIGTGFSLTDLWYVLSNFSVVICRFAGILLLFYRSLCYWFLYLAFWLLMHLVHLLLFFISSIHWLPHCEVLPENFKLDQRRLIYIVDQPNFPSFLLCQVINMNRRNGKNLLLIIRLVPKQKNLALVIGLHIFLCNLKLNLFVKLNQLKVYRCFLPRWIRNITAQPQTETVWLMRILTIEKTTKYLSWYTALYLWIDHLFMCPKTRIINFFKCIRHSYNFLLYNQN